MVGLDEKSKTEHPDLLTPGGFCCSQNHSWRAYKCDQIVVQVSAEGRWWCISGCVGSTLHWQYPSQPEHVHDETRINYEIAVCAHLVTTSTFGETRSTYLNSPNPSGRGGRSGFRWPCERLVSSVVAATRFPR